LGYGDRKRRTPVRTRVHSSSTRALRFRRSEGETAAPARTAVPDLARRPLGSGGVGWTRFHDL